MIAVIFELTPHHDKAERYFELAGLLLNDLEKVDGFVSIERFESLAISGRYLSLSFWRDEEAVRVWRNTNGHRAAQGEGRESVLSNYRLRVANVVRDYGLEERELVPADSKHFHGK